MTMPAGTPTAAATTKEPVAPVAGLAGAFAPAAMKGGSAGGWGHPATVVPTVPTGAAATMMASRPGGGEVAMAKTRVEVDLGRSRKSGPSGWIWAKTMQLGQIWAGPVLLGLEGLSYGSGPAWCSWCSWVGSDLGWVGIA
jgi:hypothetical protein